MNFFVTATSLKTDGIEAYVAEEAEALAALRAEGVVSAAYRRVDGKGVLGIVHGDTLADAEAQVARLPYIAHGFMKFEYSEVVPL